MKRCPITYEIINDDQQYSQHGLRLLSPQLNNLNPLQMTAQEQQREAINRAGKMSIQGVQTKLSALLKIKEECFEIVDSNGRYILKTQSFLYPEAPQNEAITMSLAETIGIEVPVHGLVYSIDNSMTYFIKRFDRLPGNKKLATEDFAQLLGLDRDTKYEGSMEKVISVISKHCSFPKIEFVTLFKLTLFNFLIGNKDMHLKNFSLITRNDKVTLSPAYDLLNSSIAVDKPFEEMALPLMGGKNNLTRNIFFRYFAEERLGLNQTIINEVTQKIQQAIPGWRTMISNSFLSTEMKEKYLRLLEERRQRLDL